MAQKKITDLTLRSDFDSSCNVPIDDAVQTYRVTGSQMLTYMKGQNLTSQDIQNLSLVSSVASSALTIAVKTAAGNSPSSTDSISVAMRSSTLTSGSFAVRTITSDLSIVISSGSTLGQTSTQASRIYVYLIDNAGALELAVSHKYYPEDALVSTTAEGGAGAADSATAIYSTTARSNVACRLIGYIDNTQTTAGTWTSAGSQIELLPKQSKKSVNVQKFTSGSGTFYTSAGVKYLEVKAVGGGGGGGGGGSGGGNGSNGGDTTFGTMIAAKGTGFNGSSTGGTVTLGMVQGTSIEGGNGSGVVSDGTDAGGAGGDSAFGGSGRNLTGQNTGGGSAKSNSGSGGSGGNGSAGVNMGGGGAAGGFVWGVVNDPDSSYSYSIGTGGSGGSAGTGGGAGGAGASGYLEIIEYF